MVEGTHHWRSGDISGAPVMSRLFNIMRGGRVHLDVPKGIEFPVGIRTLLNTSRYVTTCTSGLSSLKSTVAQQLQDRRGTLPLHAPRDPGPRHLEKGGRPRQ